MKTYAKLITAALATAGLAVPAAAQTYYPQTQTYAPQYGYQQGYAYPQQSYGYPQQSYGYQNGYQNGGGAIEQIIGQLLGNRYSVTDQQAVARCASAVLAQAQGQYGGYGQRGYGYNGNVGAMRVTSITSVQRRTNGLRVQGTIGTGYAGGAYGYQNRAYGGGDMSFRCNVDYRGAVTGIRIGGNNNGVYRRY